MKTIQLVNSRVEIDPLDPDYTLVHLTQYPAIYLTKLMLKANELGLEGKKIGVVEVKENFATRHKYVDFVII